MYVFKTIYMFNLRNIESKQKTVKNSNVVAVWVTCGLPRSFKSTYIILIVLKTYRTYLLAETMYNFY